MSKNKLDPRMKDLGQKIGNGINIIPNPEQGFTKFSLPSQTVPAKNFYTGLRAFEITVRGNTACLYLAPRIVDDGYAIPMSARPIKSIFGEFGDLTSIVDGSLESRMFRPSNLTPITASKLYLNLVELTRMAIKESGQTESVEQVPVPNQINLNAITKLEEETRQIFTTLELSNQVEKSKTWEKSKTSIKRFYQETRDILNRNLTDKNTVIPKTYLEIFKHIKWILGGFDKRPAVITGQFLLSYGQDVLIPYFDRASLSKNPFDQVNLNTNFFSIGQVWEYQDTRGQIYTPLTVNNLDTGYLYHSLEIRFLFDALKNVGPRLSSIQSTYEILSTSIQEFIHRQAKVRDGENYNQPMTDNQIRVTSNTLLAGFYNDIVNDFKESSSNEITEKEEILDWILSLFQD